MHTMFSVFVSFLFSFGMFYLIVLVCCFDSHFCVSKHAFKYLLDFLP